MIDAVSLTDETLAISGPHGFTQLSGVPSDTDTPPYERLRHLHGKFASPFFVSSTTSICIGRRRASSGSLIAASSLPGVHLPGEHSYGAGGISLLLFILIIIRAFWFVVCYSGWRAVGMVGGTRRRRRFWRGADGSRECVYPSSEMLGPRPACIEPRRGLLHLQSNNEPVPMASPDVPCPRRPNSTLHVTTP